MILGFEDFMILSVIVSPLYYNTYTLWKVRSTQKNCLYCQRSKELIKKEIENI